LSIASLFKSFLRELEDPLMTAALAPEYERAFASLPPGAATMRVEEGQIPPIIEAVLPVLAKLPYPNLKTFLVLNEFLSVVASHAAENKMDPKNLSIVFAPNMFIGSGSFNDMQSLFLLCSSMITNDKIIQNYFADLDNFKHPPKPAEAAKPAESTGPQTETESAEGTTEPSAELLTDEPVYETDDDEPESSENKEVKPESESAPSTSTSTASTPAPAETTDQPSTTQQPEPSV